MEQAEKRSTGTFPSAAVAAVDGLLENYRLFQAKIDTLCRDIEAAFPEHLACRAGCSGCCRHISIFWVEAVALAVALRELPGGQMNSLRSRALSAGTDGPCPLLDNDLCLLYAARPVICRTHGLPLLTIHDGAPSVDFCPMNFTGAASLPGRAIIDLGRLNTTLAAVNALFVESYFGKSPPENDRLSIAEALILEV